LSWLRFSAWHKPFTTTKPSFNLGLWSFMHLGYKASNEHSKQEWNHGCVLVALVSLDTSPLPDLHHLLILGFHAFGLQSIKWALKAGMTL
jgi:hypothetical protein